MTMAISTAVERDAKVVICASTGNTSASAAAYAARAGTAVRGRHPAGADRAGQARAGAHPRRARRAGARQLRPRARDRARAGRAPRRRGRELGEPGAHRGPEDRRVRDRRRARRRAHRPLHPGRQRRATSPRTGRATREYAALGQRHAHARACSGGRRRARRRIVRGEPVLHPETLATAIQIGNPASWQGAIDARDESGGHIGEVTDAQIIEAYRLLAADEGCFVEPASAASVAGLLQASADGLLVARRRRRVHRHRPRPQGSASAPSPRCRSATPSRPPPRRSRPRWTCSVSTAAGHRRVRRHRTRLRRRARRAGPRPRARRPRRRAPRRARRRALAARTASPPRCCAADLLDRGRARRRSRPASPTPTHPVDLLVNNAGFGTFGRFAELDIEREVRGGRAQRGRRCVRLTHAALGAMEARGAGAILNLSSLAAYQPAPNSATYGATKAFVHSFTHAVHEEPRGTGVHVMLVCPGYTHTEFHDRAGLGPIGVPEIAWQSADQVVACRAPRPGPRPIGLDPGRDEPGGGRAVVHGPGHDHAARRGGRQAIGVTASSGTNAVLLGPHTDSLPVDVRKPDVTRQ